MRVLSKYNIYIGEVSFYLKKRRKSPYVLWASSCDLSQTGLKQTRTRKVWTNPRRFTSIDVTVATVF